MASIRKRGNAWQVQIVKLGVRDSATFDTKAEAQNWATKTEADIISGKKRAALTAKTLASVVARYIAEVTPLKRGAKAEALRLNKFIREFEFIDLAIGDITAEHLAKWRDLRLKSVQGSSVLREFATVGSVFEHARREWRLIHTNPVREVRKPKDSKPRDNRVSSEDLAALAAAAEYTGGQPKTKTHRVYLAVEFAIETALRAGEICQLRGGNLFIERRYLHLEMTKNGTSRDVPLSTRAIAILNLLDPTLLFESTPAQLDALFRKLRAKACALRPSLAQMHFHDTRHEAITRLSKKLDVLALARMVGHKDIKMLMIYYNETAQELAQKLD